MQKINRKSMKVIFKRIQDLDETSWKEYFYLLQNVNPDTCTTEELLHFKEDRLDQYEKLPLEYKMEEGLLTYEGKPIGSLAYTAGGGQYRTFLLADKYEDIPGTVLKGIFKLFYDYIEDRESVFLWSKNPATNSKLKQADVKLITEAEGQSTDCQFELSKKFLEDNIE